MSAPDTTTKAVTITLKGGMGNQMFQYAFGRALEASARGNGVAIDLFFDISAYTDPNKKDTKRPYMLPHLNVVVNTVRTEELRHFSSMRRMVRRAMRFLQGGNEIAYSDALLHPPYRDHYEGYWQSEKYFSDISEQLRQEFTLHEPLERAASKIREEILNEPHSVSIFYRRTDYVGHKDLDIGEQAYQQRAIERMRALVPDMKLYVMSDDIEWVRTNAQLPPDSVFVSSEHILPHEEMFLMSACKHHIIPNSTFAWWGAWLDADSDKIVIAPTEWSTRQNDVRYRDIVPEAWVRV